MAPFEAPVVRNSSAAFLNEPALAGRETELCRRPGRRLIHSRERCYVDNDAHAIDVFAVGFLPVAGFDLFGKAGLVNWDSKFGISDLDFSEDHDGTDAAYGVGAQFRLGSFALRGEYEVFDFADDVNMLSVGVSWTFF